MKYYYLLKGKIMSANEKMPELRIVKHKDYNQKFEDSKFKMFYNNWLNSLQPCEISESEKAKVIHTILANNTSVNLSNPIEVTNIVRLEEIKTITKSGTITDFHVFFKHPKQVDGEIEAVEFAEWTYKNHWVLNQRSMSWYIELPSGVIDLSTGKTSIELYEIFKKQK